MTDVAIRIEGRAGRITLQRAAALNALTHDMILSIDAALAGWAVDEAVALIIVDAAGDRAFCSGGDIMQMYATGMAGDYAYGRRFWRDEYRMNARIARYAKPVVTFLQGYTMGGGVGLGCHASHRVVCDGSRIAMPECGIGLIPDVGGTLLLARAPGHLGEYLGTTGARMGPGDAILCGFADTFLPQAAWPDLIATLTTTGTVAAIATAATDAPDAPLAVLRDDIDAVFGRDTAAHIAEGLVQAGKLAQAATLFAQNAPLSVAVAIHNIRALRSTPTIEAALDLEYRFVHRAMEYGDFLEGIRATLIDRDGAPRWRHASLADVTPADIARMTAAIGAPEEETA